MCLGAFQHVLSIDVADDDQRRVAGDVVPPVVAEQIVARHRAQVVDPSNRGMTIRVGTEGRRRHFRIQKLIWIILAALQLGDDDGTLGFAVLRLVQAIRHALRFDEEQRVERIVPRRLEIGGLIDPGVAVPAAAKPLDDPLHLVAGDVSGSLEIHVLDPMRHAGVARRFVSGADTVPTPDRHEGTRVELLHQNLQAIVEMDGSNP